MPLRHIKKLGTYRRSAKERLYLCRPHVGRQTHTQSRQHRFALTCCRTGADGSDTGGQLSNLLEDRLHRGLAASAASWRHEFHERRGPLVLLDGLLVGHFFRKRHPTSGKMPAADETRGRKRKSRTRGTHHGTGAECQNLAALPVVGVRPRSQERGVNVCA